jgi:pimeloyl-ACP methyl ester carboxylesterase
VPRDFASFKEAAMPTVQTDNADIYYDSVGQGPAVILAHGAEGNALSWFQQVPVFAKHYQTVVFDHRGFGRSTCAADHLQPNRFGADILAVMDALGIAQAAIVGQSMAGWGAMQAALVAPERVSAVALVATSGGLMPPAGDDAPPDPNPAPLAGNLSGLALAPDFPDREPHLAWLFDQISLLNHNIELLAGRLGDNLVTAADLAGYTTPTVVVAPVLDSFFPPAMLQTVGTMIPGARFETLEASGHAPYWEVPDAFNTLILDFLSAEIGSGRS